MNATKTQLAVEAFYWLPYCSTCIKAQAWLLENGITIAKTHDMKASPLNLPQVEALAQKMAAEKTNGAEALFSKRALKYRALGLHQKTLTEAEMLTHMSEEYTFIKRPVAVWSNGTVTAGFSAKQWAALIKANN